jgi:hypothetical protein
LLGAVIWILEPVSFSDKVIFMVPNRGSFHFACQLLMHFDYISAHITFISSCDVQSYYIKMMMINNFNISIYFWLSLLKIIYYILYLKLQYPENKLQMTAPKLNQGRNISQNSFKVYDKAQMTTKWMGSPISKSNPPQQ